MSFPHEDAAEMARDKTEEIFSEWHKYWRASDEEKSRGILSVTRGQNIDWETAGHGSAAGNSENGKSAKESRRWIFALRHGERVDLTFGHWAQHCFDENNTYTRKDLNMPIKLGERAGGAESYQRDTPLTRVGRLQAQLVGEGLRLAGIPIKHVYASAALRCVETANFFLEGLGDPSLKIKVEPGLFEFKGLHLSKGLLAFMTPEELHKAGYRVDLSYKPYIDLLSQKHETLEECFKRNEYVMHSVVNSTEEEGGNIVFIGHATTLDTMAIALQRYARKDTAPYPYTIGPNILRVPYCAMAAMRDKPFEIVSPPCPPSINSSSGRFDWKILKEAFNPENSN